MIFCSVQGYYKIPVFYYGIYLWQAILGLQYLKATKINRKLAFVYFPSVFDCRYQLFICFSGRFFMQIVFYLITELMLLINFENVIIFTFKIYYRLLHTTRQVVFNRRDRKNWSKCCINLFIMFAWRFSRSGQTCSR